MPPATPPLLAASAFAHACAVVENRRAATEAAILALRRGGRAPATVLGHARHEALARAGAEPMPDLVQPVPDDLAALARALTFTRPAAERAVVDLAGRYGFDQGDLGRALGMSPADAAARTAEVNEVWQRELDPVLFARMGAGSCDVLRELLTPPAPGADDTAGLEPPSLGDLVGQGASVGTHVDACDACRDRLRAMVSVRTLVVQQPFEDPPAEVLEAALGARRRASSAAPGTGAAPLVSRHRRGVLFAAAGALAVALAAGIVAQAVRDEASSPHVTTAGTSLGVVPAIVDPGDATSVRLRNGSQGRVEWHAASDASWVVLTPASGGLDARDAQDVAIAFTKDVPEGAVRATVTFTSDEGSTAVVRVRSTVGRAPDIAARIEGCGVSARVEDETEVGDVVVHWREGRTERTAPMRFDTSETWTRDLPPAATSWWVSATDGLGNEGATSEERTTPPLC